MNCTTKTYQNGSHVITIRWEHQICIPVFASVEEWKTGKQQQGMLLLMQIEFVLNVHSNQYHHLLPVFFSLPSNLSKCISTSCPKFTCMSRVKHSIVRYAIYVTNPTNSVIPNPVHYAIQCNSMVPSVLPNIIIFCQVIQYQMCRYLLVLVPMHLINTQKP